MFVFVFVPSSIWSKYDSNMHTIHVGMTAHVPLQNQMTHKSISRNSGLITELWHPNFMFEAPAKLKEISRIHEFHSKHTSGLHKFTCCLLIINIRHLLHSLQSDDPLINTNINRREIQTQKSPALCWIHHIYQTGEAMTKNKTNTWLCQLDSYCSYIQRKKRTVQNCAPTRISH